MNEIQNTPKARGGKRRGAGLPKGTKLKPEAELLKQKTMSLKTEAWNALSALALEENVDFAQYTREVLETHVQAVWQPKIDTHSSNRAIIRAGLAAEAKANGLSSSEMLASILIERYGKDL